MIEYMGVKIFVQSVRGGEGKNYLERTIVTNEKTTMGKEKLENSHRFGIDCRNGIDGVTAGRDCAGGSKFFCHIRYHKSFCP